MIKELVHFHVSHTYDQFTDMLLFVVGECEPGHIRKQHAAFDRDLHRFLLGLEDIELKRMELWLSNQYSSSRDKSTSIARLLNQSIDL